MQKMIIPTLLMTVLGWTSAQASSMEFQNINITEFGLRGTNKLVLTFDDGPGAGTAKILDILKKNNIKATFFANGNHLQQYPILARRIVREGHILANHSYQHDQLSKKIYSTNPKQLLNDLGSTHKEILKYAPDQNFYYFRAPFGAWTNGHANVLNRDQELRKYIGPIFWTSGGDIRESAGVISDAADWACWGKKYPKFNNIKTCAEGYLNSINAQRGGVILMHDIHNKTASMFEYMLPILIKKGYKFVNIDEVPELKNYEEQQSLDFIKSRKLYYKNK